MRSVAVSLLLASLAPLAGAQVTIYDNFVDYDNAVDGIHTLFVDFETDRLGAPIAPAGQDIEGDVFSFDVVYSSPDVPSSRVNIADVDQGVDHEIGPVDGWNGTLRWEYGKASTATAFTGVEVEFSTLRFFRGNTLVDDVLVVGGTTFEFFGFVSTEPFDRVELEGLFFAIDAHYSTSSSCVVLDFETEDDFSTALVNGQHIDTEFGTFVSITSAGSNAGAGIFDSTTNGPNDPSQDRDLLVDTGNVLILQTENFPPDGDDIFPRPNDDDDGGTIGFAFSSPVEATSVTLIDIDAGDGASTVALIDGEGRQRVFTVPSNWTGDLLLGDPGQRVLDLTTLADQPGLGSPATASESAGFDSTAVVRIEVELGGSGALDDLRVCFTTSATIAIRNGAAENAQNLTSSSLPVLGSTWSAVLDCTAYGRGTATLVGRRWPSHGTMTPFGEVLVSGALVFRETRAFSAAASTFTWGIPNDMALIGLDIHFQGDCREAFSAPTPGKMLRVRRGLSNALDLVLGF